MPAAAPVLRLTSRAVDEDPADLVNMLKGMIAEHRIRYEAEMQQLAAWRIALDKRQQRLEEREEKLRLREESLSKAKPKDRKTRILTEWNDRVPCDYCGTFYCTRDRACFGPDGNPLHGHHNCANCHNAWKKGEGKGRRVPGA